VWFCDTPRAYLYVFRRIQSNLIMPLELPADIDEHGLALWETADLLDNFLGGLVVGTGSADLHGSLCGTDFNQFNIVSRGFCVSRLLQHLGDAERRPDHVRSRKGRADLRRVKPPAIRPAEHRVLTFRRNL
jgi:hypothetical protein